MIWCVYLLLNANFSTNSDTQIIKWKRARVVWMVPNYWLIFCLKLDGIASDGFNGHRGRNVLIGGAALTESKPVTVRINKVPVVTVSGEERRTGRGGISGNARSVVYVRYRLLQGDDVRSNRSVEIAVSRRVDVRWTTVNVAVGWLVTAQIIKRR